MNWPASCDTVPLTQVALFSHEVMRFCETVVFQVNCHIFFSNLQQEALWITLGKCMRLWHATSFARFSLLWTSCILKEQYIVTLKVCYGCYSTLDSHGRSSSQCLLKDSIHESISHCHNQCQIQICIPACIMRSEFFPITPLSSVRLKILEWIKCSSFEDYIYIKFTKTELTEIS